MSSSLYFTLSSTLLDIAKHPSFKGFGHLMLPWDDNSRYNSLKIQDVSESLLWHTHINPNEIVNVLNRMVDEVGLGKQIFYNIYSNDERKRDPLKYNTGLFFLRGQENAPFAIVNAGGGFAYVGSLHEGFPIAQEINDCGLNAFVLKYRVESMQYACEDLARAISFIFSHAKELGVSTNCYSLWGGSAGARMAATLGSFGPGRFGEKDLPRAGTVVMGYTGHSQYTPNDPPTYVVVGTNDWIASHTTMEARVNRLKKCGIDAEFHCYRGLTHGFGTGTGTIAHGWVAEACEFWKKHF